MVLGAGFGGLNFCKAFRHPGARITLVDRQNHHLFQPLLYQVATAGLSAPDIAEPVRAILSRRRQVTVLLDEVRDLDLAARRVYGVRHTLTYDYLVLALGGVTSYFGHPEWEQFAPGLKTLEDALRIRREVLLAFERAESESDPAEQERLMTVVVIGGGPTGVELAGALAELTRLVLRPDFRRVDPGRARVILLEGGPRLLPHLPSRLSESARRQLERLGVEVRLNALVRNLRAGEVELRDGTVIRAGNLLWAAGVSASPLTARLGVPLDPAGRIHVQPDLSLPGHPEVFAIGDLAHVVGPDGRPVPGVAPAAMQMARHVARLLTRELNSPPGAGPPRPAFRYFDKGTMATIGRSAAVAKIGPFEFGGPLAWLAWLFIHLLFLVGFDNKASVLLQWVYSYFTYRRGARVIVGRITETASRSNTLAKTTPTETAVIP